MDKINSIPTPSQRYKFVIDTGKFDTQRKECGATISFQTSKIANGHSKKLKEKNLQHHTIDGITMN